MCGLAGSVLWPVLLWIRDHHVMVKVVPHQVKSHLNVHTDESCILCVGWPVVSCGQYYLGIGVHHVMAKVAPHQVMSHMHVHMECPV